VDRKKNSSQIKSRLIVTNFGCIWITSAYIYIFILIEEFEK